ncbi:phosphate ABC transporter permease PstA [Hathewaya histolytica]|uniref:phosphate ABC transporter permease PstA n=1 Tax=Hathewaya histolytica TaxID=1498 RepID=UPI003B6822DC
MNKEKVDKIWTCILYIISTLVVLLLVSLLGYILFRGRHFFSFNFLFGSPKIGESGGGIGSQLFNSIYMLVISLIISIPLGIGAGIYLAEYSNEGIFIRIVRLCIETMASLPSIVVGFFGLLIFVISTGWGFTILSGALSISILNLPGLTRVSEDAIRLGGEGIREASLGLGATKWQTIIKVILPNAFPKILTGIILAAGRIFGEAAALLYTSGMSAPEVSFKLSELFSKNSAFNVFRPGETLSVYIWKINSEGMIPDADRIANGASAVLILMVLIFNISSRIIGNKIYKSYTGKK